MSRRPSDGQGELCRAYAAHLDREIAKLRKARPVQAEIPGADDFNLAGETATEWQPPPKGDDLTGELPL